MDYSTADQRGSAAHRIWEAAVTVSNWLVSLTVAGGFLLMAAHAYAMPYPAASDPDDRVSLVAIAVVFAVAFLWGCVVVRLRRVRASAR